LGLRALKLTQPFPPVLSFRLPAISTPLSLDAWPLTPNDERDDFFVVSSTRFFLIVDDNSINRRVRLLFA
jgi:hypothetical protein